MNILPNIKIIWEFIVVRVDAFTLIKDINPHNTIIIGWPNA